MLTDGSCLTVTGKTLAENLAEVEDYPEGLNRLFYRSTRQLKKTLTWWCLKVTCVQQVLWLKLTGKEGLYFEGPARVFEGEIGAMRGILDGEVQAGEVVVIAW